MKKKLVLKFVAVALAFGIVFSSCVSSTTIQSNPSGADLYIDGYRVGVTPYLYADSKIVGSTTTIEIVKDGYEPYYTAIYRSEQLDAGALIGGLFTWIPFLWIMKYQPMHSYDLVPISPEMRRNSEKRVEKEVTTSKATQLKELKELLDSKIITQEEFDAEKAKILNAK